MPGGVPRASLVFGAFEIDPVSGEIRRRGRRVRLDDKAFQLLLALVERPGVLVSRDELVRRLWREDVFVDFDKNLNNAVGRVRGVLGDSATRPRFIETLPRKGYRFIGAVERRAAPDAPASAAAAPIASVAALTAAVPSWSLSSSRGSSPPSPSAAGLAVVIAIAGIGLLTLVLSRRRD